MALSRSTGSLFTGLRAWWVQRLSAVYMLLFLIFLLVAMAVNPPHPPHVAALWRDWVARPVITAAFLVFIAALLIHMWVGLRDVLLDYAKPVQVRNGLLVLVAIGLLGMAVWVLAIVLRLHG